jgi:hypothetical protein
MLIRHIYPILASLLFLGCNNAYRANYTSISVTKPVADYLSNQTLTIHNNKPNTKTRNVKIHAPFTDTFYKLNFKKIAATTVILEVSDSTGKIRNVAIPQTKLRAYPIGATTTTTPIIVAHLLKQRNPDSYYDYPGEIATGIAILSVINDAIYYPALQIMARNRQFTVPKTFVLNDLSQVQTLDTNNPNQIYTITQPVNPNITPYLDADFQKHTQVFLAANAGYGFVHRSSRTSYTEKLSPSPWFNVELNFQGQPALRWGLRYDWSKTNAFFSNTTSLQLAYVNTHLKNANLICGVSAGVGRFTRLLGNDFSLTSDIFLNRKLGADSFVITRNEFVPNQSNYYLPLSAFIQYESLLAKDVSLTLGVRICSMSSFSTYSSKEFLKTTETIAPGITAERWQNINYPKSVTHESQNLSFQCQIGLNFLISQ